MEAYTPKYYPNLNEIIISQRTLSIPPKFSSPIVEKIKSLTLDSGTRHDMADCILNNILACTLWEHLQQNLYTTQSLEEMAREYCRQATIEWERF